MSDLINKLVIEKEKKGSYLLGLQEGNQIKDILFTSHTI